MLAQIDSLIRVSISDVHEDLYEVITRDLSPKNPDKERALKEGIQAAKEMPDQIPLWREEGEDLVLPRGYAHRLEHAVVSLGQRIEWESSMTLLPYSERCFRDWPAFELRDYQAPARDALLDWAQGIYKAPTGAGKSRVVLEFARWAGQRTLIVVGKTSLARQWQEMAREGYGYETGYIGEGEWRDEDLSVAIWQTLHSRKDSLPAEFWASWGCVVADEVHHLSANSLSDIFNRFPAFYRIGCSATPRWDATLFPIVEAVIGPVIFETTDRDVGDRLVRPSVEIVESTFEAEYTPTRYRGGRRIQNNFNEVMAELSEDPERNDLIADIAREEARNGHHVLVVTRRIEHVRQLVSRLEHDVPIGSRLNVLTGAQTGADAERIKRAVERSDEGTVLISTTADEGFDLPRLDRLILAFPIRRTPLIEQQVGRIRRPYPGKADAVVFDVEDSLVNVLRAQSIERRKLYARRRWKLVSRELAD